MALRFLRGRRRGGRDWGRFVKIGLIIYVIYWIMSHWGKRVPTIGIDPVGAKRQAQLDDLERRSRPPADEGKGGGGRGGKGGGKGGGGKPSDFSDVPGPFSRSGQKPTQTVSPPPPPTQPAAPKPAAKKPKQRDCSGLNYLKCRAEDIAAGKIFAPSGIPNIPLTQAPPEILAGAASDFCLPEDIECQYNTEMAYAAGEFDAGGIPGVGNAGFFGIPIWLIVIGLIAIFVL